MAASLKPLKAMVVEINQTLATRPAQGWTMYRAAIRAYIRPEDSTTVVTVKITPLSRSRRGERS
ncbi:hypothetical protein D3C72_2405860 [compost metagenome]